MRPYWAMLNARFRALLQYRAAAVAGLATQIFWGLIRMMIFAAFFANAAHPSPMSKEHVIAYIWLGQAFWAMFPLRVDGEVAGMISSGNVAYELLRPVDLYALWFSRSIAARTAPTMLRAGPILLVAALAGWIGWTGPASLAACAASLVAALLLSSAFGVLMTLTLFWTVSGRGLGHLMVMAAYVLGGMVIPLPLFPDWLQPVLNVLPFRGLVDVPFRLYTGHIPAAELPAMLAHQLGWALALIGLGRWMLRRAARDLVVQGG